MKRYTTLLAFAAAFYLALPSTTAQIQSVPVNFVIRKLVHQPALDKIRLKLDLQTAGSEGITAIGVLSMCNCYCDSLWDAWPAPSDSLFIPGAGTLHFVGGGGANPTGPQTGVLGISGVEGGIERDSDFNLWLKFLWVEEP